MSVFLVVKSRLVETVERIEVCRRGIGIAYKVVKVLHDFGITLGSRIVTGLIEVIIDYFVEVERIFINRVDALIRGIVSPVFVYRDEAVIIGSRMYFFDEIAEILIEIHVDEVGKHVERTLPAGLLASGKSERIFEVLARRLSLLQRIHEPAPGNFGVVDRSVRPYNFALTQNVENGFFVIENGEIVGRIAYAGDSFARSGNLRSVSVGFERVFPCRIARNVGVCLFHVRSEIYDFVSAVIFGNNGGLNDGRVCNVSARHISYRQHVCFGVGFVVDDNGDAFTFRILQIHICVCNRFERFLLDDVNSGVNRNRYGTVVAAGGSAFASAGGCTRAFGRSGFFGIAARTAAVIRRAAGDNAEKHDEAENNRK